MTSKGFVIGVDGGGSKTRAMVASMRGDILGDGVGRSSNVHDVGELEARRAIRHAMERALAAAGLSAAAKAEAVCLGLAGIETDEQRARVEAWAAEDIYAGAIRVVRDPELVLAAGTPGGSGVALVAGTGAVAFGCTPDGRTARCGGWGWILGDEGSGFDIGWHALRLATKTADGRSDAHLVLDAVLKTWGLPAPRALIGYAQRHGSDLHREVAKLAHPIVALAPEDAHAHHLIAQSARALAELVNAVTHGLSLECPALALAGGVLVHSAVVREQLMIRINVPLGPIAMVKDPALGAVKLALASV